MPVLGITGGVACGKTTFAQALATHFPNATCFCADAEVNRLTREDFEVRQAITNLLGREAFSKDGAYERKYVRHRIFEDAKLREQLNEILHPRVRVRWQTLAESHRAPQDWLLLEIPLLFETGGETHCDRVITVGCTAEVQMHRLTVLRGLSIELAEQIRVAQWSIQEKSKRADHLIWNDCPQPRLNHQAHACAAWLKSHYATGKYGGTVRLDTPLPNSVHL